MKIRHNKSTAAELTVVPTSDGKFKILAASCRKKDLRRIIGTNHLDLRTLRSEVIRILKETP